MHFCIDELRAILYTIMAAIPGYYCVKCFLKSRFGKKK